MQKDLGIEKEATYIISIKVQHHIKATQCAMMLNV